MIPLALAPLRVVRRVPGLLGLALLAGSAASACGGGDGGRGERGYELDPQLVFWQELHSLCGAGFPGRVTEASPVTEPLAGAGLVMRVTDCDVAQVSIALIGGGRSWRTLTVTTTAAGLRLDNESSEDGDGAAPALPGGESRGRGTATSQVFPADDASAPIPSGAPGPVWVLDLHPDSVFAYGWDGVTDGFRLEFDLSEPVEGSTGVAGRESLAGPRALILLSTVRPAEGGDLFSSASVVGSGAAPRGGAVVSRTLPRRRSPTMNRTSAPWQ